MLKKKCSACARKIERKFNFCPYCGFSFKTGNEQANFGMLGRDDSEGKVQEELKLPFGMNKIVNSLMKQLEGQLGNVDMNGQGLPKGIQIRVARGPGMGQVVEKVPEKKVIDNVEISDEEVERRIGLRKVDAESRVRRLADRIVYEIDAPGVVRKDDVVLTELATGLEIRAYSEDKCYVKFIPLKVQVLRYSVEKERVFVELKS